MISDCRCEQKRACTMPRFPIGVRVAPCATDKTCCNLSNPNALEKKARCCLPAMHVGIHVCTDSEYSRGAMFDKIIEKEDFSGGVFSR